MRKGLVACICMVALVFPSLVLALDFDWYVGGVSLSVMEKTLLSKAKPDECFNGIGVPPTPLPCTAPDSIPKVNEAYVWGLAKSGQKLFYGTAPNVLCLVLSGYLGMTTPVKTDSFVCEFGSKDWRAPQIYLYDLVSRQEINLTKTDDALMNDPLLKGTLGLRSAGSIGDVVFLAGPGVRGGINMFAFNGKTGKFISSKAFPDYNNIRKWLEFRGCLYTAVGKGTGGSVLKWTGSLSNLWSFVEVGALDSSGAEMSAYGCDRIAVSTWPGKGTAGVFISPVVPLKGGLAESANAAGKWKKIWKASDYEPNPIVAATYGGGSLAFYDGWLYWGTMHVPMVATEAHIAVYGQPSTQQEFLEAAVGTHRAISIFRGRNLTGTKPEIQLLYGEKELPVYDPGSKSFVNKPTGMKPRYGSSGFGNPLNNYTWEMKVVAGQLFVGTMDWSYLYNSLGQVLVPGQSLPSPNPLQPILLKYLSARFPNKDLSGNGADLWRFRSSNSPAVCESFDGVGNFLNYGIRTMVVGDDNTVYIGTANPMNLEEKGGWELYELKKPRLFNLMNW
jgi:hypothetical protein